MTAELRSIPEHVYHSDPCETPSLSSSIAKLLVEKSPMHAHSAHPRLGAKPIEPNEAMDHGSLSHKLLLGEGAEVEVIDADDYKSKAAREARDAARAAGKIPALSEAYARATESAAIVRNRLSGYGIELDGVSEQAILWTEQTPHGSIWCRGLLDHLRVERVQVIDLKTCRSAHPRACASHVIEYGYDVQQEAYTRALDRAFPDLVGRWDFVFVFAETVEPYAVTPARLDAMMRERGRRRWEQACGMWAHCLKQNVWPGYVDEVVYLESPPWLLSQMEERP
jgi:hypothetical protein